MDEISDGSESEDIPPSSKNIVDKRTSTKQSLPIKPVPEKREGYWVFHHFDTLAETDNSRNSTGYMKNVTEYKRNYFKQHNVENFVPKLNENIEKLFSDIKDSAQLPKPQLIRAPYASMNLDSMALSTKKKLFENYYSSVKKYYMEDSSLIKSKEPPPNLLKSLEDVHYEKERIAMKSSASDVQTCDEVEAVAKIFYKCNNELREISGLKKEILRLINAKKQRQLKVEAEKLEEEINKKIYRNIELQKERKLRIPFQKDFGFTGYQPIAATHDEVRTGPKYPLFLSMGGLVAEQQQRQVVLQKLNKIL